MAAFSSDPIELYVAHIPGDTTEAEVKNYFQTHDGNRTVVETFFVTKAKPDNFVRKDGKKNAVVAIVRMGCHADAMDAKAKLNRTHFRGNLLNVRWSQSQRVLWIGRLHETVTNEQLLSAFSQFGPIQKARVIADPAKGASKCHGFVVFEGKREASKAMSRCQAEPFIVGPTVKPVKVEYAWLLDGDGGYSEEMKQNKKLTPQTIEHSAISRFIPKGCREYPMSLRINELYNEYARLKVAMKGKLVELQNQVVMSPGPVPPLSLFAAIAQDPAFAMSVPRPTPGPQPLGYGPRPGVAPPGATLPQVPKPAPPSLPPQGYAPPGPRPPQVPPPRVPPVGQYPVPGPRPPPTYGARPPAAAPAYPPAGQPAYGTAPPQYGAPAPMNKRPAEAPLQSPPTKAHAVDYGTGAPSMAQALSYATQQVPDPYAGYQQQQQQQYAPAAAPQAAAPPAQQQPAYQQYQQPQAVQAPAAAPSSGYPGYDPVQYQQSLPPATTAPATGYYQDANAGQQQQAQMYQQQYQGYQ